MEQAEQQMEKVTQSLMQACDDMNVMARDSVDAIMQSASALSRGCEEFSKNLGGIIQESLARSMSVGKTMMGAKTMREILDMQTEFAKDCFDTWMSSTSRLSEISTRCAQEALEPVAKQANCTMGKIVQMQQQTQERAA